MQFNLFLCVRWGHAESPDGADGEDTSFVVRASSHEEAAQRADVILGRLPTQIPGNLRGVEQHCHRVVEIGIDTSNSMQSAVIAGPVIAYASCADTSRYRSWSRGDIPGEFVWRLSETAD